MSDIEEIVENAKKPGKFNIVDVVKGRSYPTDQIDVFIDEGVAFRAAELNEAITKISETMDKKNLDKKDLDEFLAKREEILNQKDKLIEEMGGTRYVFHLTGISEGKRQDIYDKAVEKFPVEYEKNRNAFTGETEKVELENPERDRYFTSMLWQASITKIVSPDGEEQEGITLEDAIELRRSLPLASNSAITEAIEKMRAATAVFMMAVNEDFLAKS
jgi:hypothetical protein